MSLGMTAVFRPVRRIELSLSHAHSHGPLSYLEIGDKAAPAVVLIHGFGADLLTWQLCLIPLASHYRVIALDLPGHGRSSADVGTADLSFMTRWLDEMLDVLDVPEAHVVGHSMGAKIALGHALAQPHRVASLALISPAGLGGDFHHATLDAFLMARTPEAAETLARHLLGPKGENLMPALVTSLLGACADAERHDALTRLLGHAKSYGLALSPEGFDWSRIRCPVRIMWGDHDRLIPMPSNRNMPPIHVIEGAGHLPHMEASGAVVSALKEFLP